MNSNLGASARRLAHATGVPRVVRNAHFATLQVIGRARRAPRRQPVDPTHLRILGVTKKYVPDTRSGTEITLHCMLRQLQARGHHTRALVMWEHASEQVVDGIEVLASADGASVEDLFEWADVVIATGEARGRALRAAALAGTPLAFYVQVGNMPRHKLWGKPDLTVFNSTFVERQYPWTTNSIVVHPPIEEADYTTTPGDSITLVNLVETKGGRLLYDLAERMPDRRFLGVRGWGPQVVPERVPANVTILDPQLDMRSVYSRTRVLIMPSAYESYGRVALEAAASGIPTIAHPAGGLREALGDSGIWANRNDANEWAARILELDDPAEYQRASARARRQFESLDGTQEIDELERALISLATRSAGPLPGARRNRLAAIHRMWLSTTARDITRRTATRRALVLAPHPDDETLGCGATILRKVDAGTSVRVVVATDGSRRDRGDSREQADHAGTRRAECVEACRRLGVSEEDVEFLGFEDGTLGKNIEPLAAHVGTIAEAFLPDEVFVPSGIDSHADHRALALAVASLRTGPLRDVELHSYPVWFWNRWAWTSRSASARHQRFDLLTRPIEWTLTTRARRVSARGLLVRKRHALEAHATQLANLDPDFVARCLEDNELFFPFRKPYPR